jgi:hypothetical protein
MSALRSEEKRSTWIVAFDDDISEEEEAMIAGGCDECGHNAEIECFDRYSSRRPSCVLLTIRGLVLYHCTLGVTEARHSLQR